MSDRKTFQSQIAYLRTCVALSLMVWLHGCGGNGKQKAASPDSVAGKNSVAARGDAAPLLQLDDSCRRWPIPDSKAGVSETRTTEELENEFRMSREVTDANYAAKYLEISGTVLDVGNNLGGESVIRLGGADRRFEVICVLRSAKDSEGVATGESCRLRGVYCVSILPVFIHCTVVRDAEAQPAETTEDLVDAADSGPQTPEVTLTAEQLASEFDAGAQDAMRKYAGKVMQVAGQLSRISHGSLGEMRYHLGSDVLGIQYFVRMGNPWSCVRPGQTVTLVGKGFASYPCLVNCELIGARGTADPIHAASTLGESLEADRDAFRKQFYLKQITVTGEVLENVPAKEIGERPTITLRSTADTKIVCEIDAEDSLATESVQAGKPVTITGWNTKESPTDSIILVQCLIWRGK